MTDIELCDLEHITNSLLLEKVHEFTRNISIDVVFVAITSLLTRWRVDALGITPQKTCLTLKFFPCSMFNFSKTCVCIASFPSIYQVPSSLICCHVERKEQKKKKVYESTRMGMKSELMCGRGYARECYAGKDAL